jgi:hypothetical protein
VVLQATCCFVCVCVCVRACSFTLLQSSSSIMMGKQRSWLLGRMWRVGFCLVWAHTLRNPCDCTVSFTLYFIKLWNGFLRVMRETFVTIWRSGDPAPR